jgi:hypothetical protein
MGQAATSTAIVWVCCWTLTTDAALLRFFKNGAQYGQGYGGQRYRPSSGAFQ